MRYLVFMSVVSLMSIGPVSIASANEAAGLRLVPFPKSVELRQGMLALDQKLVLEVPAACSDPLSRMIATELQRAGLPAPEVRTLAGNVRYLRLSSRSGVTPVTPTFRKEAGSQDYILNVQPDGIDGFAPEEIGLHYAAQTLCQLVRANRRGSALPCVNIRDWPSMAWRGFQDDMTRGPSAHLDTLQREVDLGAWVKMNLLTYYMEYQYAFSKHPLIGPKDGSLTPTELKALVSYAKLRHLDILGSQQSLGHFENILKHPQYAALRETADVLSPVREETYSLLDDLYSESVPLLPFPWFNVCCDETEGLGTGSCKELASKIGAGGVYVQHMCRIHDLLRDKYGKRIMMWGDIILQHPDKLGQIPKDTIMLTWEYDPKPSYESQIAPFAKSGYDFFVCPGISDWGRVLPNFGRAMANIRNFVRDGAKHKALGVINTEWKDDAETLRGPAWHGYAWGAECAWNASLTTPEDFNRRIGAVLYGEKGDHFGQAVDLLSQVHLLPIAKVAGVDWPEGMINTRFWQADFIPRGDEKSVRQLVEPLLALVRPALEHLEACKHDAVINADVLDAVILGARRMELIGQRMLDGIAAGKAYTEALRASGKDETLTRLRVVEQLVRRNRDAHQAIGQEFARIWHTESKPYSLDSVMRRYAERVKWFEELANRMADARRQVEAGKPLPKPEEIGLAAPVSK
jgi:hexosaminidase